SRRGGTVRWRGPPADCPGVSSRLPLSEAKILSAHAHGFRIRTGSGARVRAGGLFLSKAPGGKRMNYFRRTVAATKERSACSRRPRPCRVEGLEGRVLLYGTWSTVDTMPGSAESLGASITRMAADKSGNVY